MLNLENTVLVVIDVQGKLATLMHKQKKLYKHLTAITVGAKALELPVIWMEQLPEKLGSTISEIAEFIAALEDTGRKQALVVAIEAHICVYQTAMDLQLAGYEVEVVADAVSSRSEYNKHLALNKMDKAGIDITSTEMALFELMKMANAPQFKTIAKLIK